MVLPPLLFMWPSTDRNLDAIKKRKLRAKSWRRTFWGQWCALQGPNCYYCDREIFFETQVRQVKATIDHRIPLSRGGLDDKENMVWCCEPCNLRKGNSAPEIP